MNPTDELRSQLIQEFAPRKISLREAGTMAKDLQNRIDGAYKKENDKEATQGKERVGSKPIELGPEALKQMMEKREELDNITIEEKAQARKPLLESANIKLMKDMMEFLR